MSEGATSTEVLSFLSSAMVRAPSCTASFKMLPWKYKLTGPESSYRVSRGTQAEGVGWEVVKKIKCILLDTRLILPIVEPPKLASRTLTVAFTI